MTWRYFLISSLNLPWHSSNPSLLSLGTESRDWYPPLPCSSGGCSRPQWALPSGWTNQGPSAAPHKASPRPFLSLQLFGHSSWCSLGRAYNSLLERITRKLRGKGEKGKPNKKNIPSWFLLQRSKIFNNLDEKSCQEEEGTGRQAAASRNCFERRWIVLGCRLYVNTEWRPLKEEVLPVFKKLKRK